jgi:hypothetical protein
MQLDVSNSMEQSPWEANSHWGSHEILRLLWNPKVRYCQSPPLVPILSQMNPVHTFSSYFSNIHSYIIFPSIPRSSEWSLTPSVFQTKTLHISQLSRACYMLHPSHPLWFDHFNDILWSIHVMKLLIMQSSPASRLFSHPQLASNTNIAGRCETLYVTCVYFVYETCLMYQMNEIQFSALCKVVCMWHRYGPV